MNKLEIIDQCRTNLCKYTREAYESIPEIDCPDILDLGCGTGVPSLELAGLTNGKIMAIDSDQECLDWFREKINILNLSHRITLIQKSVFEADLPEDYFDIILAEGLFNIIGFETGLITFSKLIKPGGYFMIHDEFQNRKKKLRFIAKNGFQLVKFLILDEKVWWNEYYRDLECHIMLLEKENKDHVNSDDIFKKEKNEIKMYKDNPTDFRSIYYVLKNQGKFSLTKGIGF